MCSSRSAMHCKNLAVQPSATKANIQRCKGASYAVFLNSYLRRNSLVARLHFSKSANDEFTLGAEIRCSEFALLARCASTLIRNANRLSRPLKPERLCFSKRVRRKAGLPVFGTPSSTQSRYKLFDCRTVELTVCNRSSERRCLAMSTTDRTRSRFRAARARLSDAPSLAPAP